MQSPELQDIEQRLGMFTKVVTSWAPLAFSGLSNNKGSTLFLNLHFLFHRTLKRGMEEARFL